MMVGRQRSIGDVNGDIEEEQWTPDTSDTPPRVSAGSLIAYLNNQLGDRVEEMKRDQKGVFALITGNAVVVGKQYIYGDTVSCHKRAAAMAQGRDLPLVMYIREADRYYQFDPDHILREGWDNKRGDTTMLNFKIGEGTRIKEEEL